MFKKIDEDILYLIGRENFKMLIISKLTFSINEVLIIPLQLSFRIW